MGGSCLFLSVCLVFVSSPPHLPVSGDPGFSPFPSLGPWSPLLSPHSAPTSWNPLSPHSSPCLSSLTSLHPKAPALFHLPAPGNPGFSHFPVLGHPRSFHLPAPGNPALPTFLSPEPFACGSEPGPHPPRPALPSEDRGRGVGGTPERRAQDPAAPSLQLNCLYRRARPVRKYRSGRGRTAEAGRVAGEDRSRGVLALLHALSCSLRLENFVHPRMGSGPASPSSAKRTGRMNPYSLHTPPKSNECLFSNSLLSHCSPLKSPELASITHISFNFLVFQDPF